MNLLLNNLRYTVSRIFDLYSLAPFKKLYAVLLVAMFWISLSCVVLAVGATYPVWLLTSPVLTSEFFNDGVLEFVTSQQVLGLVKALLILSMSLFGIALLRWQEEGVLPKANLLDVVAQLTEAERKMFGLCVLVVIAVHALLFNNPFAPSDALSLLAYTLGPGGIILEVAVLFKDYFFPCFLAMMVVLYSMWGRISLDIIREYKKAYLSSLTLLFVLKAIGYVTVAVAIDVLVRLLFMMSSVFPGGSNVEDWTASSSLFVFALVFAFLASLALYAPALSASFVLPFYKEEERLASLEEAEVEGDDGVDVDDNDVRELGMSATE